ncbi:MAG: hypothetical protein Q9183_005864, partial [Haloplaca sp. 2 TL-2023]
MDAPQASPNTHWGFDAPRKDLLKVVIDTRSNPLIEPHSPTQQARHSYGSSAVPQSIGSPSKSPQGKPRDTAPMLKEMRKEYQTPMKGPDFMNFGARTEKGYFGGPILNVLTQQWNATLYSRSSGQICVPSNSAENLPIPQNLAAIVSSVGIMVGGESTQQSGLWIGPRHFLSTLHCHRWITGKPTKQECDLIVESGMQFNVETNIHSRLFFGTDGHASSRVKMIDFATQQDLGVFQLMDHYPDQASYSDPDWLLERNEAVLSEMKAGQKMGCIGFSGKIDDEDDQVTILQQLAENMSLQQQQQHKLPQPYSSSSDPLRGSNLDDHIQAETRCLAPGTIDKAEANDDHILYGIISSTPWKGSSGAPCVVLDGPKAGRIIGL